MTTQLIELERGLTQLFADWMGMDVDVNIFRGFIPENVYPSVGVYLLDDIQDNEKYIPRFVFQVNGKFKNRDDALNMCDVFRTELPIYGQVLYNGIKVSEILKQSGGNIVPSKSDGFDVFEVFITGEVYFRD